LKSEVIMCEDDFTFQVNRNLPFTARFCFEKKKKRKPVGWETTSPVMSSLTLPVWSYFTKKKLNRSIFTNFTLNEPRYTKKPTECYRRLISQNIWKLLMQKSQKGLLGITLNSDWLLPGSDDITDRDAARRAIDFRFGW